MSVRSGDKTFAKKDNAWESWFFENCGEGDCDPAGFSGRFDPAIALYFNRPIMVNENVDVANGIANGTRARIIQIKLKDGEQPNLVQVDQIRVHAIHTHQVDFLLLKHEKHDIHPQIFKVQPKEHHFFAKIPRPVSLTDGTKQQTDHLAMKGMQLPIVCNNATTGHKLQGATIKKIFVQSFTTVQNWLYVVLSRVKTMNGLFLHKPLNKKDLPKYNFIPEELSNMISYFRAKKLQAPFRDSEYQQIFDP